MHIVLYEPEIPQNTGNIARLCAATGLSLHLVKPLGFKVDDKHLKRAGLDYWHLVEIHYYDNFNEVLQLFSGAKFHYATTKALKHYHQVQYGSDDLLVFGPETRGLPPELLALHREECVRLPMRQEARSLNLANTVAVMVYEALRQQGFPQLV